MRNIASWFHWHVDLKALQRHLADETTGHEASLIRFKTLHTHNCDYTATAADSTDGVANYYYLQQTS
jgi:hypothetical protein